MTGVSAELAGWFPDEGFNDAGKAHASEVLATPLQTGEAVRQRYDEFVGLLPDLLDARARLGRIRTRWTRWDEVNGTLEEALDRVSE